MDTLNDMEYGRYLVTTVSGSRYVLDLTKFTMRRMPAMDMAQDRSLRRDGEIVDLLRVKDCTVGRPMHLILNLRLRGVMATSRRSTDVESIQPLADERDLAVLLG